MKCHIISLFAKAPIYGFPVFTRLNIPLKKTTPIFQCEKVQCEKVSDFFQLKNIDIFLITWVKVQIFQNPELLEFKSCYQMSSVKARPSVCDSNVVTQMVHFTFLKSN